MGTAASAVPPGQSPAASTPSLVRQQDSQVTQVIPRRSDLDGVSDRFEQWVRIELIERGAHIQPKSLRSPDRRAIDNSSGRGTVSVNSVGACAENRDVLARDLLRACQSELLIAPADSAVA